MSCDTICTDDWDQSGRLSYVREDEHAELFGICGEEHLENVDWAEGPVEWSHSRGSFNLVLLLYSFPPESMQSGGTAGMLCCLEAFYANFGTAIIVFLIILVT